MLASTRPEIKVYKDPDCGCCNAWIDILQNSGFDASAHNVSRGALVRFKLDNGLNEEMMSCHTGVVEGYLIEGHVPPADILRLLKERPDAVGLTVPGMPYGSPGMGPETEREAYSVFLVRKDGTADVFAKYPAA
ncbi:DUF411 domain-containing protein [uncultured Shimia sp.]|uniref:DUF411 domain-containing protein n=1 Tax=uncultured Shimia sp. TaxID=573152 RepID=UPI002601F0D2|nr:DUF411 domain-containing protein [uncultured Shimia sp.]